MDIAPHLIMTGGAAHNGWVEAQVMDQLAQNDGVATQAITEERQALNTIQNAYYSVKIMQAHGWRLMNSQELETAKRLGVGFTALIFNDNDNDYDYGLISWKQRQSRGRSTSTRRTNPDLRAYAESFGIIGYRPRTACELEDQLGAAVTSNELAVIEVPVDAKVNQDLVIKLQTFWDSREDSPDYLQPDLHLA